MPKTLITDRRYLQIEDKFVMDELQLIEKAARYNAWLATLIRPYLGKRVLEIGPGIGNISRLVIPFVDLLVGIEPNIHCLQILKQNLGNDNRFMVIPKKVEESSQEDLTKHQFDTVLCMNVLEHIENDASMLRLFESILVPGGKIVLLVPAVPAAFGPIDYSLGHFRRYTRASMGKIIIQSGFNLEKVKYSNFLGLLGWFYIARFTKSVIHNGFQIQLFEMAVPIVSALEKIIPAPLGLSILAVGRKK